MWYSWCRYIRRGRPEEGLELFQNECLKWPGFVEFDDVNCKVLTYSAVDRYTALQKATRYVHSVVHRCTEGVLLREDALECSVHAVGWQRHTLCLHKLSSGDHELLKCREYKVYDLKTYEPLYMLSDKDVSEVKISPGIMLVIYSAGDHVPLKILNIEDGSVLKVSCCLHLYLPQPAHIFLPVHQTDCTDAMTRAGAHVGFTACRTSHTS